MRILLCHSHYQRPGGEDQSFAAEARLLETRGHEVERFILHNDALAKMNRFEAAARTFWNWTVHRDLRRVLRSFRPDVMHCTNTFPLLSPAAYYAAHSENVAVVQSLRNYRPLCPNALLLRDGRVCEDCLGKRFAWSSVRHGCYRGSRLATAVVAGMTTLHSLLGTWSRAVDLYFTLTEFARQKFVAAGWPADSIRVKPNFVDPDPGMGTGSGGYGVFVGRLSEEKGIATLLAAWRQLAVKLPLKVVGQGPLSMEVEQFAAHHSHVDLMGQRSWEEVLSIIGEASFLVMPSIWYETFGRAIIEAYAKGTPVIVSDLGAMAELVTEGETGLRFTPGDAGHLAACVQRLVSNDQLRQRMRLAARREYESNYTAARNHDLLLHIYQDAIERRDRRSTHGRVAAAL